MSVAIGQLGTRCPVRGGLSRKTTVDDDVGAGGEVQEPPTVALVERVEHCAAFVRVVHGEPDAGAGQRGPHVASWAAAGGFHLENVCAQVGEQSCHHIGASSRTAVGQVEHTHGIEQSFGHVHTVAVSSAFAATVTTRARPHWTAAKARRAKGRQCQAGHPSASRSGTRSRTK
ncbi:Uncharacterised protein [Mycobacterium tuberculosis]|nr:Uncharacterised protein [Mycobacterium tuberculosis]